VQDAGCRMQGAGYRVQSAGCGLQDAGCRVRVMLRLNRKQVPETRNCG